MVIKSNYMYKKGFTLIEIVMAVVIFSLIMLGVVGVFVSGKKIVQHSRARMTAAELGKVFLDLEPSDYIGNEGNWTANMGTADGLDKNYTVRYTVNTLEAPMTNVYRIKTVINWTENE